MRVLIVISGRTRQFMKLFSVTFSKIRKSFPRFFAPQFLPKDSYCVINYTLNFFIHKNFNFIYLFFSITRNFFDKAPFLPQHKIVTL
jgi:hypothetical protein